MSGVLMYAVNTQWCVEPNQRHIWCIPSVRTCRLTMLTAQLAEISRGHEELDGCSIRNKIRQKSMVGRQMQRALSLNPLHKAHTLL